MFVIKDYLKHVHLGRRSEVTTDNVAFRLHYRITFWGLMACCVAVSSRQFIKDHINCISEKHIAPVVGTFCFFSTTFTVTKYHNSSLVLNHHIAHPGVGPYTENDGIVYHTYYQWVPFILFLQALLLYLPHKLWKHSENGRLAAIVHHMDSPQLTDNEDRVINNVKIGSPKTNLSKVEWLCRACMSMNRFRVNRDWARMLVVCEVLNGINLLLQVWLTNVFFQGQFSNLGVHWWNDDMDAIETIFPKVTKCIFHKFGPTGSIQTHDTICIMSLNILNEKIYVVLWFWLVVLSVVTFISLFWRFLTFVFHNRSYAFNKFVWGEISPGPAIYPHDIETLTKELHFSDWLFLYYIGKNIDGRMFRMAVSQMAREISKNKQDRLLKLDNSHEDDPKESDC